MGHCEKRVTLKKGDTVNENHLHLEQRATSENMGPIVKDGPHFVKMGHIVRGNSHVNK